LIAAYRLDHSSRRHDAYPTPQNSPARSHPLSPRKLYSKTHEARRGLWRNVAEIKVVE
jgi:hypothetical protein